MPANLFIVRHGESRGNVAVNSYKRGDLDILSDEKFINQHSSQWRLTEKGRRQARAIGAYLNKEMPQGFDYFFTSEYARTLETAGLGDLLNAAWRIVPYLRERYRGELDRLPSLEREAVFQELLQREFVDKHNLPYYWRPPGGESLVDVCARIWLWIDTLHRECAGENVVAYAHGEVIEALAINLERIHQHEYIELRKDRTNKIDNCQVIHYTREKNYNSCWETGKKQHQQSELEKYFLYKRNIKLVEQDDGNFTYCAQEFKPITRDLYSSQDILDIAELSKLA